MELLSNQLLREIYAARAAKRSYSMRAFARDLGLSHTYLSLIFSGKKRLPVSTMVALGPRLGLDDDGIAALKKASPEARPGATDREFKTLTLDKFLFLSRWYYIALLDLLELEDFEFSPANIAAYFGIEADEVREALGTLKRLGILEQREGKWRKEQKRLSILLSKSVEAVRSYHRQMIQQALGEMDKTSEADFRRRDITGITMPINPARLAGAKRKIARFRRSLEAYLTQGACTEIYQLNVQLFPLRDGGKKEKALRERLW